METWHIHNTRKTHPKGTRLRKRLLRQDVQKYPYTSVRAVNVSGILPSTDPSYHQSMQFLKRTTDRWTERSHW